MQMMRSPWTMLGLAVMLIGCTTDDDRADGDPPAPSDVVAVDSAAPAEAPAASVGGGEAMQTVDTSLVPYDLPDIKVRRDPDTSQPGPTLISLTNLGTLPGFAGPAADGAVRYPGLLLTVDEQATVSWYHETPEFMGDARIMPDGRIVYSYGDSEVHEIDVEGNLLRRWVARLSPPEWTAALDAANVPTVEVDTDSFHHEAQLLPNGNLLSLSTELREIPAPTPLCDEDPADYPGVLSIIGDVIVEVTPAGEIVHEISLFDLLDPAAAPEIRRACGPFLLGRAFPLSAYDEGGTKPVIDWTHANAVVFDEVRNALVVSLRHLSSVIGIRYEDDADGLAGELLWELGPEGSIAEAAGATPPSFQHAVELQSDGSWLLYDNGNERQPPVSRAVQIAVADGVAEEVWAYSSEVDGVPAFSFAVGDADRLDNGNVLITNGFYSGSVDDLAAQLVEVVPDAVEGREVAFELRIGGADDGWLVYRAQRFPSEWLG